MGFSRKRELFLKRSLKRFTCFEGDFPLCLLLAENPRSPIEFSLNNVSARGLGITIGAFIEPGTSIIASCENQCLPFRTIHCTFLPNDRRYYCGIELGANDDVFNLLDYLASRGFVCLEEANS